MKVKCVYNLKCFRILKNICNKKYTILYNDFYLGFFYMKINELKQKYMSYRLHFI